MEDIEKKHEVPAEIEAEKLNMEHDDRLPEPPHERKSSMMGDVFRRLRRNKAAMFGLVIIIVLLLIAIFAPAIYPYDYSNMQHPDALLAKPSSQFPLGTDEMGRDVLARLVWGSRVSILVGFSSVAVAFIIGGILGAIAGYYGGRIDNIIMRIMDVFLAIPGTLFAITLMAALGPDMKNLVIALAISSIPGFARIVRSSILQVRDVEFIEAARAIGATDFRIVTKHVIPNSLAPVIVHTTLNVATAILTIAGLSFLGLGVAAPRSEWGSMLSSGRNYLLTNSNLTLYPGLAIMITILGLNLLGDGLRDALDPRLK